MDHLDTESLKFFPRATRIVLPRNTASPLETMNFQNLSELGWSGTTVIGDVAIKALPANHKGGRYPWDKDHVTDPKTGQYSSSYLIHCRDVTIMFCGDTAYTGAYASLVQRERSVDLAILPIGGYIPHHDNHCTPEEALRMANEMKAKFILPIHWGTLPGEEPVMEPIERLKEVAEGGTTTVAIDTIGGTFVIPAQ
jgi:L-ascorbate metabolism protein UlaG (beta-lactamase superfamily)